MILLSHTCASLKLLPVQYSPQPLPISQFMSTCLLVYSALSLPNLFKTLGRGPLSKAQLPGYMVTGQIRKDGSGHTWRCQRNVCPFVDRSSSSWSGAPQSLQTSSSSQCYPWSFRPQPRTKFHVTLYCNKRQKCTHWMWGLHVELKFKQFIKRVQPKAWSEILKPCFTDAERCSQSNSRANRRLNLHIVSLIIHAKRVITEHLILCTKFHIMLLSFSQSHSVQLYMYIRAFQLKSTAGRTPISRVIRRAALSQN